MHRSSLCIMLAAAVLPGCAAAPVVPRNATLIASKVMPGKSVVVPAGTKHLYYVQRGPISETVHRYDIEPATQPSEMPVFLLMGSEKKPVDVYVVSQEPPGD